jgi:ubiquinone/menaquinone biosynthesis C-methylase UbiE
MDDQTFDEQTAKEWIDIIESENSKIREADIYPALRSWVQCDSPVNILDIGCGQGICSKHIALNNRQSFIGIDPSPFLIKRANEKYNAQNVKFAEGNAYDLPLDDQSTDAAFSVAVWHLLEDIEKASQELFRVLKMGGRFLIITANPSDYTSWTKGYINGRSIGRRFEGEVTLPNGSLAKDVLFLHSYDELLDAFEDAGLKVLKTDVIRSFLVIEGTK